MSKQVQRRIAEVAAERDFLDAGELSGIMLELGRRFAKGASVGIDIWVDRNWLEPDELTEVLDELEVPADSAVGSSEPEGVSGEFSRVETEVGEKSSDEWSASPPETGDTGTEQLPDSAEFESERIPEREPSGRVENREAVPTEEDQSSGDPTDTYTDPPAEYAGHNSADLRSSTDAGSDAGVPAAQSDEIETLVSPEETDPSGAIGTESSSGAGFRPDRAVLRAAEDDEPINPGERFVLREELGSGGSGRVVRAFDRLMGRAVAMKILHADTVGEPEALSRFVAEAQATGQLEHPNIVPIYDFGVLPSGDAFYTMREVQGHSLRKVLSSLESGDDEYEDEYTLVRLLNILRQVSQAAEFAHVRSVVHRDLKPDNIMLGDYGEVLVMDWGLARILEENDRQNQQDFTDKDASRETGQTLGTPSYMPPEQARGDLEQVDETSDIYSLGAILYEILTLRPPFSGEGPLDVMWAVVDNELVAPSERAPDDRDVPEGLERICMKAMAESQEDRYDSAGDFHDELEAWLEGLKPRRARNLVEKGDRAAERYHELLDRIEECNEEVRSLSNQIEQWEGIEAKRELWDVEDRRDRAKANSARAFCEAVTYYTQALAQDRENEAANQGLADLYWTRLRRAEMRRDVLNTIYFKTLVEQYDPGTYEELLAANADLQVETEPPGIPLKLFEYEEQDRRLVPTRVRDLGASPVEVEELPIGSYLLKLFPERCRKIQQPVYVERDRNADVDIRLPDESEFEEGFRFIPGGEYISGGDPEAFAPREPERVHVDPFFCQTLPVTFGEYLEWFNELYDERGEAAMERAPQTREAEGLLVDYDEDREVWVPDEILIEGKARERYPADEGHEWRLPVIGVRAVDAQAYLEWRGERDDREYRLPTPHELEKAGRGVDGRRFPWGDQFDATFCKMRFSRPETPSQPEPVGAFENDVSPYGVRDLAGGVQEWCQPEDESDGQWPVKGGGWAQDERVCHLAGTVEVLAASRTARTGFRLVYEPDLA